MKFNHYFEHNLKLTVLPLTPMVMSSVQGIKSKDDTPSSKHSVMNRYLDLFSDRVGTPEWKSAMLALRQLFRSNVLINGCKAYGDSRLLVIVDVSEGALCLHFRGQAVREGSTAIPRKHSVNICQSTRRNDTEDSNLHEHRCENLKSHAAYCITVTRAGCKLSCCMHSHA